MNSTIKINDSKPPQKTPLSSCFMDVTDVRHKNHQQHAPRPGRRTHPSPFHFLCGHDNHVGVLLIHHLPEVDDRILKAPLGGDEDFAFVHVASLFVRTLCGGVLIRLNVQPRAHLRVHSLCVFADVCKSCLNPSVMPDRLTLM